MKKIALIPFTCGAGASTPGCEEGPSALQKMGLDDVLRGFGHEVQWFADPDEMLGGPSGRLAHALAGAHGSFERNKLVFDNIAQFSADCRRALDKGFFPLTLGGDHSMALGSIAALAQAKGAHGRISVLWIDAHADINTPQTSPSQALHGMPLAALLGMGSPDFVGLGGPQTVLQPENLYYLGLRDVDAGEWETLRRLGIAHKTMEEIRALGVMESFAAALAHLSAHSDYLFISLDLDALDPAEAPSVGTPVHDGFKLDEILPALEWAVQEYAPAMIEIAEFNPTLRNPEKTFDTLCRILKALL